MQVSVEREGEPVNHMRLYRVHREAGLCLKRKKRIAAWNLEDIAVIFEVFEMTTEMPRLRLGVHLVSHAVDDI